MQKEKSDKRTFCQLTRQERVAALDKTDTLAREVLEDDKKWRAQHENGDKN